MPSNNTWNVTRYRRITGSFDDTGFEALTKAFAAIPQKRLIKKPLFHDEIQNGHEPKKMKSMPLPPSDYILRNKKNIPNTKNLNSNAVMLSSSLSNIFNDTVCHEEESNAQQYDEYEYEYLCEEYVESNHQEREQDIFRNEDSTKNIDNLPGNTDNIPTDVESTSSDIW